MVNRCCLQRLHRWVFWQLLTSLLLVSKSQLGLAPKYLSDFLCKPTSSTSTSPLHSADHLDLFVPRIRAALVQFIHSFGHFYSAPSSPLLLRGAPDYSTDAVSEFHAEAHRQLQVKDLPKVLTWRLERESNPRPSG